jgi:aminopeptidase N
MNKNFHKIFCFYFRKLLATQFQPTDARKAFPCFDEPELKARFRINIIHPENTIALANFPISVCLFINPL